MLQIIGHAIVSADGKIAAADGGIPPELRNDADWQHFQTQLDRSDLVVLGRLGHQRFPNPRRRRLVATKSVETLADDPNDARATLWNPAGMSFTQATEVIGLDNGIAAIAGVFDLFADLFTAFDLAESHQVLLPTGLPCFATGHPRLILGRHGLVPKTWKILDPPAAVTLTRWQRP